MMAGRPAKPIAILGYVDDPVSFGGGVNSVALVILLVNGGWRGPIVFADTGAEWTETYEYLSYFQENFLRHYGLEITRLGKEWRTDKSAREMDLLEYCRERKTFPNANHRWCTSAWKVRPLERWCHAHGYCLQDLLVGISADEARRKPQRRRPLVDHGITREDCARVIAAQGLALPRKSGCWFCPFQTEAQWRELYVAHPELFAQAVELEEAKGEKYGRRFFLRVRAGETLREFAARIELQGMFWPWQEHYNPSRSGGLR
jgi:3'-phosphoadenosine 5'-phosphosulfate sulfotransferase (PAPS reductase)/FAD synthetase